MKTGLIANPKALNKDIIYKLSNLPYNKIVIISIGEKKEDFKLNSKTEIIYCENKKLINKTIDQILSENSEIKFLPYFLGDYNSRYAIKIYNHTFGTKVNQKIFKEKDEMMNFLGDIAQKKFLKFGYKELIEKKYSEIKKIVGDTFIVKPTNASSSTSTFKVGNESCFEEIKNKISKDYNYITEEYIEGELFSLDFFMDGEKIFLLNYVREIPMIELSDKNKFSEKFLNKYGEEISKHFNFHLAIIYPLGFEKIGKDEEKFLETLRIKLAEIKYKGVIHLEYKHDKKNNKVGFIEWGARYGGYRREYIKKLYHTDTLKLDQTLLIEKDYGKFEKLKGEIYKFKEKEFNLNFAKIKTNFIDTKSYIDILNKTGDITGISFKDFIERYFREKLGIITKDIKFDIRTEKNNNFLPFYKDNTTRFDYILELDDENFALFRKKKFQIIEKTIFHDYD